MFIISDEHKTEFAKEDGNGYYYFSKNFNGCSFFDDFESAIKAKKYCPDKACKIYKLVFSFEEIDEEKLTNEMFEKELFILKKKYGKS